MKDNKKQYGGQVMSNVHKENFEKIEDSFAPIVKKEPAINVKKFHPAAVLPKRGHDVDAGLDLHSYEKRVLEPGKLTIVQIGLGFEIPKGYVGMVADRSSMACRGLKVTGGIIDTGYTGEISVGLWNLGQFRYVINPGDRIAQILIIPVSLATCVEVQEFEESTRGPKGFGSTGK